MTTLRAHAALWLAAALAVGASGCALTSKGEAIQPRFYSPDIDPPATSSPTHAVASSGAGLRLGRVHGGNDLKEQIVYRESPYEVGFYEDRLWAERPDVYLRRALARALYQERGVREVVSGPGPSLDAELTAFEEVRGDHPVARVRITWALHDELNVLRSQTVTIERPFEKALHGAPAAGFVAALSLALRDAVEETATSAVSELAAVAVPPPVGPAGATPPPATPSRRLSLLRK